MKTIGTIALALIGIGLVTTPADAGKRRSKKKAKVEEAAPRRLTDAMIGGGIKLATPTGVTPRRHSDTRPDRPPPPRRIP